MAGAKQQVEVDGHRIALTNLDKVLYPATGTTKGDVIAYYAAIAPHMLPHLRDRPVTRKRWVDGVGTDEAPGKMFFQKDLDAHTPEWVQRRAIQHRDHANDYPLVGDVATLTWLGQIRRTSCTCRSGGSAARATSGAPTGSCWTSTRARAPASPSAWRSRRPHGRSSATWASSHTP